MNFLNTLFQTLRFFILILLCISCISPKIPPVQPAIIPIPLEQVISEGTFTIDNTTAIQFDASFASVAQFLKAYIENGSKIQLQTEAVLKTILFKKDTTLTNEEAYRLQITKKQILIAASSPKGAFYAVQSLRQLLPVAFENGSFPAAKVAVQCVAIKDVPRFAYRGMHLDVGRHFFSVAFIKKYIDMMSLLKMNTFHWHLTEDQGWRIEIKKYPKLQEIAAYRKETLVGHYNDAPQTFDGKPYGGYYTQEEVKEIVNYAAERQITVIPEIEMPGHSQAALSAYPELGCTGKPVDVATKWGVFEDIYCPKETTFAFLENVLDEVIDLFPGKYIHIGGDEAPKARWKTCKHCQQLIQKEHLKDEQGLQSYFIARIEKYLNSKGKQIIGWDEILEGGLAPNATVMSWRGTAGAVAAAKQQHPVILTPSSHCYFDYYQATNEREPLAIGGFLPLEKVYHFNPIPKELNAQEAAYVLGAQGNVWTEYMKTPEKVEYMAFPRMVALSEVVWSDKKHKDYKNFVERLVVYQQRLAIRNVNYANHLYEISAKSLVKKGNLFLELSTAINQKTIRYTTDGTMPTENAMLYKAPIKILESTTVNAMVFEGAKAVSTLFKQRINVHKAVGKNIVLQPMPHQKYNAGGITALINGIDGSNTRYGDKEWLGFSGDDVSIALDLGKETFVEKITTRFYHGKGQWIYAPSKVKVHFPKKEPIASIVPNTDERIVNLQIPVKSTTRYLTLEITNFGLIPDGQQGAGHKAWLFIDEIYVE